MNGRSHVRTKSRIISSSLLVLFGGLLFLLAPKAHADGYNAAAVLGQYDLGSSTQVVEYGGSVANNGQGQFSPNPLGFWVPQAVELDSVNHRLFVADHGNSRVLVFPLDSQNRITTTTPSAVFGQTDFSSNNTGVTASEFGGIFGLAYDPVASRLFVVDQNRVLVFDASTSTLAVASTSENAEAVIGQPDFISNNTGDTRNTFNTPDGIAYDSVGKRLFVADSANNRVMVFDASTSTLAVASTSESAEAVIGQADYTSLLNQTTKNGLSNPQGVTYDTSSSRIFIEDSSNNRVIVFDASTSTLAIASTSQNAEAVLGEPDYTTGSGGTTQNTLGDPLAASYDSATNRLFVADSGNNRVLVFDASTSTLAVASTSENAEAVIGQADYVSTASTVNQSTLNSPSGVVFDPISKQIFVADAINNRIMVFDGSVSTLTTTPEGESAINELGEYQTINPVIPNSPDFSLNFQDSGFGTVNQYGFSDPEGMALDSANHRLFVSDRNSNRVLVFPLDSQNNISTSSPSAVIGQISFTAGNHGTTQDTLWDPVGLAYDPLNNRLFVGDDFNCRVLVFDASPATLAVASTSENAEAVLGEPNYTSHSCPTSQAGLTDAYGVAYDASSSRLFVADADNFRVMVFDASTSTLTTTPQGESAEAVIGQTDFDSSNSDTTQSTFEFPVDVAYDPIGKRLFVGDDGNCRVLVFDASTSTLAVASTSQNAEAVLGEPDYTSDDCPTSQDGLTDAYGVAYNPSSGQLFVNDGSNERVMVFDASTSTLNATPEGENANAVIGQSDFTSSNRGTSQNDIDPRASDMGGLSYDPSTNHLFMVDGKNHRVLQFNIVSISTPSLASGTSTISYSQTLNTTSSQGTVSFALASGALPGGLSLATSTGVISGTPTTPGTFNFSLAADDNFGVSTFSSVSPFTIAIASGGGGSSGTSTITLATSSLSFTATSAGTSTNEGTQHIMLSNGGIGSSTLTWTAASSQAWLTIVPASGSLATNASTSLGFTVDPSSLFSPGVYNATATITAAGASNSPRAISVAITISPQIPTISPSSLPAGTVGTAYSQTITGLSNVSGTYTWSITSGSIPPGLAFDTSNTAFTNPINGTPTVAGTYPFTIAFFDGLATGTQPYSLVINAASGGGGGGGGGGGTVAVGGGGTPIPPTPTSTPPTTPVVTTSTPSSTPVIPPFVPPPSPPLPKPVSGRTAFVFVVEHVVNTNGGTLIPSSFAISVKGTSATPASPVGSASGVLVSMKPGAYSVSQKAVAGYAVAFSSGCSGAVASGTVITCVITTNDLVPPSLTVFENVVNNSFGTDSASDFIVAVKGTSVSPASFAGNAAGTFVSLAPGKYTVSEKSVASYTIALSSGCSGTAAYGVASTCTITATDPPTAHLVVTENVTNGYGGTKLPSSFAISIKGTGASPTSLVGNASGVLVTMKPGSYSVTQKAVTGYATTLSPGCSGTATTGVTLTCTITTTQLAPPTLTVTENVINSYFGTETASNFTVAVSGTGVTLKSFAGNALGTNVPIAPGKYSVTEKSVAGYTITLSSGCSGTAAYGVASTCVITASDPPIARLIVNEDVLNNYGGTKTAGNFTVTVQGTKPTPPSFVGNASGTSVTITPGTYSVSQKAVAGYAVTLSSGCAGHVVAGEIIQCDVVTSDLAPETVFISENVVNNYGGTMTAGNFTVAVSGKSPSRSSFPGSTAGTSVTLQPGAYSVTQKTLTGYTVTLSSGCKGTATYGASAVCLITETQKVVKGYLSPLAPAVPPVTPLPPSTSSSTPTSTPISTPTSTPTSTSTTNTTSTSPSPIIIVTPPSTPTSTTPTSTPSTPTSPSAPPPAPEASSTQPITVTIDDGQIVVTSTDVTITPTPPLPPDDTITTSNEGGQDQTPWTPAPTSSYPWTLTDGQGIKTVTVQVAAPGSSEPIATASRSVFLDLGQSILSEPILACNDMVYLNGYAFSNHENDPATVIKIQQFLNKFLGTDLAVNGVYNSSTQAAVDQLQLQYNQEILQPWVPYGLPNPNTPTNNTYKTTQRWINILSCPGLNLPTPVLP